MARPVVRYTWGVYYMMTLGSNTYMQGRETGGSESCKIVRFGAKITCACMSSHIDVD
jgi:hypothetical protein